MKAGRIFFRRIANDRDEKNSMPWLSRKESEGEDNSLSCVCPKGPSCHGCLVMDSIASPQTIEVRYVPSNQPIDQQYM